MLDTTTQFGFTQTGFEAFLETRSEPDWLTDFRRAAWERFEELDWPARNDEEWLRTDVRLFKLDRFGPTLSGPAQTNPAQTNVQGLLAEGVELGGRSVAVNGRPSSATLHEKWRAKGVIFGSLDELVTEHDSLVRQNLLRRAVNPYYDRYAALHAAFWSGGHLLYVPRGVVISEPLHAPFRDCQRRERYWTHTRHP